MATKKRRKLEEIVEQLEGTMKTTKRNTWIAILLWILDKLIIFGMIIFFGQTFC